MYYIAGFARHTDLEHFSKRYDDAFGESPELSSVLMSKGGTIGNACVHRRMDQYRLLSCQAKKRGGGSEGLHTPVYKHLDARCDDLPCFLEIRVDAGRITIRIRTLLDLMSLLLAYDILGNVRSRRSDRSESIVT